VLNVTDYITKVAKLIGTQQAIESRVESIKDMSHQLRTSASTAAPATRAAQGPPPPQPVGAGVVNGTVLPAQPATLGAPLPDLHQLRQPHLPQSGEMASDALIRGWTASAVRDLEAKELRVTPAVVCDAVLQIAKAAGWKDEQLPPRDTIRERLKKSLKKT